MPKRNRNIWGIVFALLAGGLLGSLRTRSRGGTESAPASARPPMLEPAGDPRPPQQPRPRPAAFRVALAATFTVIFFAGAAFTAGAGDRLAAALEGDDVVAAGEIGAVAAGEAPAAVAAAQADVPAPAAADQAPVTSAQDVAIAQPNDLVPGTVPGTVSGTVPETVPETVAETVQARARRRRQTRWQARREPFGPRPRARRLLRRQ